MKAKSKLLPVRLREMWESAQQKGMSSQQCMANQDRELEQYTALWKRALLLPNESDLVHSTLVEVGRWRGVDDLALIRRRCEDALWALKHNWETTVDIVGPAQVEKYYDAADASIEELLWWHTLTEDNSPLAYVAALEFAQSAGCNAYLDFGSGVGSGALLFESNGFATTLADISSVLLAFCRHRFHDRERNARFIDLKETTPPSAAFDFITAMDVFEHLVDPVATVDLLHTSLKPGGYIYGRFAAEKEEARPQHIVYNFQPVFDRLAELGCKEVFRDDWLWGHQVFQKAPRESLVATKF